MKADQRLSRLEVAFGQRLVIKPDAAFAARQEARWEQMCQMILEDALRRVGLSANKVPELRVRFPELFGCERERERWGLLQADNPERAAEEGRVWLRYIEEAGFANQETSRRRAEMSAMFGKVEALGKELGLGRLDLPRAVLAALRELKELRATQ